MMVLGAPRIDPDTRTWTGRHIVPAWVLESNAADAGRAYQWVAGSLFPGIAHGVLASLAARVPSGANGAMAYLGPSIANMGSMGAGIGGFLFPLLSGVRPVEPIDLLKAVFENVVYAIKGNLGQLEAVSGSPIARVALCGGMTGHGTLEQIVADVLGREVFVPHTQQTTGLGAAMCAAVGAGIHTKIGRASCRERVCQYV